MPAHYYHNKFHCTFCMKFDLKHRVIAKVYPTSEGQHTCSDCGNPCVAATKLDTAYIKAPLVVEVEKPKVTPGNLISKMLGTYDGKELRPYAARESALLAYKLPSLGI